MRESSQISHGQSSILLPLKPEDSSCGDLFQRRESFVDFRDRELNLLLSNRMCRGFCLLLEVEARQFQRLHLPNLLRIYFRGTPGASLALGFELLHTLLDPRLCVYESFSGVTHKKC